MKSPVISRREYYGTVRDNALWILGILGAPGLMLYGLLRYPLLDQNDPIIWRVPAAAYAASLVIVLWRNRSLFPWGDRLPFLKWQAVVAFPVVPAMAVLGAALLSNALLDHGQTEERPFLIVKHPEPTSFWISPVDRSDSKHFDLYVRRPSAGMAVGRVVLVRIRPGFFHRPWVEGQRLTE